MLEGRLAEKTLTLTLELALRGVDMHEQVASEFRAARAPMSHFVFKRYVGGDHSANQHH